MIRLGVNVDHVATVRQARGGREPDPVAAAVLAVLGGADGITVHLREDRRHVQDRDVFLLRDAVDVRLNLEMSTAADVADVALRVKPDEATLVPERRQERTTEGGLDVAAHADAVRAVAGRLKAAGVVVSLFIGPELGQVDMSAAVGADAVEFHTGTYADARGAAVADELAKLAAAAAHAKGRGLHVHMGHGLNYRNVAPVVRIPGVEELNIGHAIVSRAVLVGMERAVRDMKAAMAAHFPNPRKGG